MSTFRNKPELPAAITRLQGFASRSRWMRLQQLCRHLSSRQALRTATVALLTPALRLTLKEWAASAREQLHRACLWRWEAVALPTNDKTYRFVHVGRRSRRAETLFRFAGAAAKKDDSQRIPRTCPATVSTVLVGDLPTPGALRVPLFVHAVVPLKRPLEDIVGTFEDNLRRVIRQQQASCEVRRALSDRDIEFAEKVMLRPYANARHGPNAAQLDSALVKKMARTDGRLDIVYQRGEAVACNLCHAAVRDGKTYWTAMRAGYPEAVFSDPKRLRQVNTINSHLGMAWAHANDFDFYDIGLSIGSPDDGCLRWKRSRGGHVDTRAIHSYFYVRLPKSGTARFLWDSPLFESRRDQLTLHIGLPDGIADDVVVRRYRELGYGGLQRVCLHHAQPPGAVLTESLRGIFTKPHHGPAATFEMVAVL